MFIEKETVGKGLLKIENENEWKRVRDTHTMFEQQHTNKADWRRQPLRQVIRLNKCKLTCLENNIKWKNIQYITQRNIIINYKNLGHWQQYIYIEHSLPAIDDVKVFIFLYELLF